MPATGPMRRIVFSQANSGWRELGIEAIPESEISYVPTVATHTIESLPITYGKR